jgi:ABC-type uncharacterized transport system permease subunit
MKIIIIIIIIIVIIIIIIIIIGILDFGSCDKYKPIFHKSIETSVYINTLFSNITPYLFAYSHSFSWYILKELLQWKSYSLMNSDNK